MAETPSLTTPAAFLHRHWPALLATVLALPLYLINVHAVRLDYGPDEPHQLQFIHVIAREGRMPTYRETNSVQHPPGYHLLLAPLYRLSGNALAPMRLPMGPSRLATMTPAEKRARFLCRYFQVLLTVVVIWLLAALAREARPGRPRVHAVALVVLALSPTVAYMSAVVNNDMLAALLCCLLAWQALRLRRRGDIVPWQAALGLGLLMAVALWTKVTTVYIAPLVVLLLWRGLPRWTERLQFAALFAAVAIGLGCWWYVRSYTLYGTPFPNFAGGMGNEEQLRTLLLYDPFGQGWQVLMNALGTLGVAILAPEFSWAPTGFLRPVTVDLWLRLLVGVGLTILLVHALPGKKRPRPVLGGRLLAFAAGGVALEAAEVLYFAFSSDYRAVSVGRYMMLAAPWFLLLLVGVGERLAALLARPAARLAGALAVLLVLGGACVLYAVAQVASFQAIGP